MSQKINLETARSEYLALRENQLSLQMATIDAGGLPEASYAPFVWHEDACFLFLSQLARHTQNLNTNPAISLLLIEDEAKTRNQFARRRIIWHGLAEIVERREESFAIAMQCFRDRFGDFIEIIEPLQDFQLFKVVPQNGRFIRGFAQAYQLQGEGLNEMIHVDPGSSSKP